MYPYLEVFGIGFNMTGLGIIISLLIFLGSIGYLCKKYHKNFLQFFYVLPGLIILPYVLGAYVSYLIGGSFFPISIQELEILLSPKEYHFHYVGLVIGLIIGFWIFFSGIKRQEDKKVWIDIVFSSFCLALIPLGIFFLLGDNFLGKPYEGLLSVSALHPDSILNKFQGVYPVGIFVSLDGIASLLFFLFMKRKYKRFGLGLIGFIVLILLFNIVLLFQQYPKYVTINYDGIIFDIKNYISFITIMMCLYCYHKWNRLSS